MLPERYRLQARAVVQQSDQIRQRECDATRGRQIPRPGAMEKYCTAGTLHSRYPIIVQHPDDVVEIVLAPEPFINNGIGYPDKAIVVPVSRHIAPGIAWRHGAHRQGCSGSRHPVGSIVELLDPPDPAWAGPVVFVLQCGHTGSPDRTWQAQMPEGENTAGRPRAPEPYNRCPPR